MDKHVDEIMWMRPRHNAMSKMLNNDREKSFDSRPLQSRPVQNQINSNQFKPLIIQFIQSIPNKQGTIRYDTTRWKSNLSF